VDTWESYTTRGAAAAGADIYHGTATGRDASACWDASTATKKLMEEEEEEEVVKLREKLHGSQLRQKLASGFKGFEQKVEETIKGKKGKVKEAVKGKAEEKKQGAEQKLEAKWNQQQKPKPPSK
jgi:hypothetical protein